jgi:hypothetical protein
MRSTLFLICWMAAWICPAATIQEDFAQDPLAHGWRVFGNTNLFHWNAANKNLEVTWDSSQTNSYFQMPLGTILTRQDDFSVSLGLNLSDVTSGVNSAKPSTFELAFGFQNSLDAQATNFWRGTAKNIPNLVEFDFFPGADVIQPTVWPSMWSTNAVLNYNGPGDYTLIDLPTGVPLAITLSYSAASQTLSTTISANNQSIGAINSVKITSSFTDFRVGTFALESYSDAFQKGSYPGSLLAHGIVNNITIVTPPPPVQNLRGLVTNGVWQVQFLSRTNWNYTLEETADFKSWRDVSATLAGNGGNLILRDTNVPTTAAFYRVRSNRP